MLFDDYRNDSKVVKIIPDTNGEIVEHQYSCCCCDHFSITGRVVNLSQDKCDLLYPLIQCDPYEKLNELRRVFKRNRSIYVLGGHLIKVGENYYATNSCD